jgi:hypothetical protein
MRPPERYSVHPLPSYATRQPWINRELISAALSREVVERNERRAAPILSADESRRYTRRSEVHCMIARRAERAR